MRLLVIALVVAMRVPHAHACWAGPRTHLASGNVFEVTIVPEHPSLFVSSGWDASPELLEVTSSDGVRVPFARVPLNESWTRVDLDIDRGFLLVRVPGTKRYWYLLVDPAFHPSTRSVEVNDRDGSLQIDSDAPILRCEWHEGESELFDAWLWGRTDVGSECERVVATYADRSEDVIFVRSEYARRRLWRQRGRMLAMALGVLLAFWRAHESAALYAS
jgi:hypothetical protein